MIFTLQKINFQPTNKTLAFVKLRTKTNMLRGETLKLCPDVRMRMFHLEKKLVLRDSFRKKIALKQKNVLALRNMFFFKKEIFN